MSKTAMMEKDPTSYSLITYIWVIGLSAWGGIAGYIRRVKTKNPAHFSLAELVGEVCISGFVGVLTFYFCESAKINPILAAALVGISGHMGSRALYFLEAVCKRKISQLVGTDVENL
jgi:hypothetical protein